MLQFWMILINTKHCQHVVLIMCEVIVNTIYLHIVVSHLANIWLSLTTFAKIFAKPGKIWRNLDHIDEHLTKFDNFDNILVWSTWYHAYSLYLQSDKFIQRPGRKRLEGADRGPNADPDGRADSRADSGADCCADGFLTRFWFYVIRIPNSGDVTMSE